MVHETPPPGDVNAQAWAWNEIFTHCCSLGLWEFTNDKKSYTGIDRVKRFIDILYDHWYQTTQEVKPQN